MAPRNPDIADNESMRQIRIVCVSDTHGQHSKLRLPPGDILVHAGDFMTFGDVPEEIIDFDRWLQHQPHRHKIVIAGNHDLMFERQPGFARTLLPSAIYLENSSIELEGLRIWGSPVQPEFNNWAFNVARGAAIRRYWQMIPEDTDILITHGPPHGVLDKPRPSGTHLGCEELAKKVEQLRPKLHVFGHIHGGHGQSQSKLSPTKFVNASVVDEAYRLVHEAQVVDVPARCIKAALV